MSSYFIFFCCLLSAFNWQKGAIKTTKEFNSFLYDCDSSATQGKWGCVMDVREGNNKCILWV